MIHYHGSPCGGDSAVLNKFYQGRHGLISFYRPDDVAVILDCCQTFCVDNGAYSFWRKNGGNAGEEYWARYIEFTKALSRHPGFDFWLIPDVIDGSEDDNWRLIFEYGRKIPYAVPVYHMHESFFHLERLLKTFPRIAIGSSGQWPNPGTPSWWDRMSDIMDVCCDEDGIPKSKLHGLRMLDPKIFSEIPLSSADSTNAVRHAGDVKRFGMYPPGSSAQRANVIADRIESNNSAACWTKHEQQKLNLGGY